MPSNLEHVTNFSVRDVRSHVAKDVFTKLARKGVLAKSAFHAGTEAHDPIIYNTENRALFYDSDGTGSHATILFAPLSGT